MNAMKNNAKQMNDVQLIVTDLHKLIDFVKGLQEQNTELLTALKKCEAQLSYMMDSGSARIGTASAIIAARKAIENAEKTLPSQ